MEIQHFVRVAIAAAAAASIASPTFASSSDTQPLSYSDVKKIIAKGGGNPKKNQGIASRGNCFHKN